MPLEAHTQGAHSQGSLSGLGGSVQPLGSPRNGQAELSEKVLHEDQSNTHKEGNEHLNHSLSSQTNSVETLQNQTKRF